MSVKPLSHGLHTGAGLQLFQDGDFRIPQFTICAPAIQGKPFKLPPGGLRPLALGLRLYLRCPVNDVHQVTCVVFEFFEQAAHFKLKTVWSVI